MTEIVPENSSKKKEVVGLTGWLFRTNFLGEHLSALLPEAIIHCPPISFSDTKRQEPLPETYDLIGWSFGGMLALQQAARFPEKIRRMVLIATTPHFTQKPDYNGGWPEMIIAALRKRFHLDFERQLRSFAAQTLSPAERRIFLEKIQAELSPENRPPLETALRQLNTLWTLDLREMLSQVKTPTLIIAGTQDEVVPYQAALYLQEKMPNTRLVTLDGGGHIPFLTRPEETGAAIREFLESGS